MLTAFVSLLAFATTLLVSLLLVLTQRWHGRFSLDGTVGVQKAHTVPTPRIGGIAILAGLLAAYGLAAGPVQALLGPMLVACLPAFVAGLLEDLTKKVGVSTRLLATMCSGVVAWYLTGIAMRNTGVHGFDQLLLFTPLAVVFTGFAVGGVANAVNMIDGFNGLAAGTVAIMLAALGLIALRVGDVPLAAVAFVLVAVALGFGAVNWPLGKLFLGDGGAYLLGFLVAWVAVALPMRNPSVTAWATMLACGYPVTEALYSMWRRWRKHQSTGAPDNLHLHSLVESRVILPRFPGLDRTLQNAAVSPAMWLCALLPAALAVAFCENRRLLILSSLLTVAGYHVAYRWLAPARRPALT